MAKFIFNKLVRDKLVALYEELGQHATYITLSKSEHLAALRQKIIEEAREIPSDDADGTLIDEIADVQQALDDLKVLHGISSEQVAHAQQQKYDKKGGFLSGAFVETIELQEGDPWLDYYRSDPVVYREINESETTAQLQSGIYEHYKGNRYEVIGVGKDTETEADVVIYRPLYESDVLYWVRPYTMFIDTVVVDGLTIPRFKRVSAGR